MDTFSLPERESDQERQWLRGTEGAKCRQRWSEADFVFDVGVGGFDHPPIVCHKNSASVRVSFLLLARSVCEERADLESESGVGPCKIDLDIGPRCDPHGKVADPTEEPTPVQPAPDALLLAASMTHPVGSVGQQRYQEFAIADRPGRRVLEQSGKCGDRGESVRERVIQTPVDDSVVDVTGEEKERCSRRRDAGGEPAGAGERSCLAHHLNSRYANSSCAGNDQRHVAVKARAGRGRS